MSNIPHASLYTYHSSYNHTSTKTDHSETNRHPITTLSRPAPRSGETVSLRQVHPPPRRGLKQEQESSAGSRLGETPLAWASCVLAQKHTMVAWATTRTESSGRASAYLA